MKTKFFLGIRLNTTSHKLIYNKAPYTGDFAAIPSIQFGYHISKRTSMQIGIAYGNHQFDTWAIYRTADGKLQENYIYSKTHAVVVPLTLRYILSNPNRRLQVFGSASFIPTYGTISSKKTEKHDDITTVTYNASTSGLNAFITAGVGLDYHISRRFEGYGEVILINNNLQDKLRLNAFKSLGLGVNYKL